MSDIILRASHLCKSFPGKDKKHPVKAVNDVSLEIERGTTYGLVGESGSGKTTLGRTLIRLIEPDSGNIYFEGQDITSGKMNALRKKMQIIFQNPQGALDPRSNVLAIITEGLKASGENYSRADYRERVGELMEMVGLNKADMYRYPHEFSGGQQQRIGIARTLAVNPSLIICDEPVSSLDVSYQAQIINLLEDLQQRFGLTYLFIAHDISVVKHISDRIGVMYGGRLMEEAEAEELYRNTLHPYSQLLFGAIPIADPIENRKRVRNLLMNFKEGQSSDIGCPFALRCPKASDECMKSFPESSIKGEAHMCACHNI